MIEALTQENELLKAKQADLQEAQYKLVELETEASGLKTDNANLQIQLESTNARVQSLEQEMTVVKMQMGEEISRANATVSELNREKETLLSVPKSGADEALRQELESLKSEQILLKQKCEDLQKENEKLQYEMVKARAQSSGLERVCFNYKNQMEDFLKKINEAEVNNGHLSQVKTRLEGTMQEIKLQNEELLQKDQLAQFELEKNRSRLVSLEREYEDFKARTQQKDQQA
jgi:predicted  nucleic acid-binding Zn-ribbon protein